VVVLELGRAQIAERGMESAGVVNAGNEVLGDSPFELDAVGAVLGHGFHPLKARQPRSIPNPQSVHRQGAFHSVLIWPPNLTPYRKFNSRTR
jgi:hypothetical protein